MRYTGKGESMVIKPTLESKEQGLINFAHEWVKLCANGMIEEAFSILDDCHVM